MPGAGAYGRCRMNQELDIADLDKADLLAALFNGANCRGQGADPGVFMTREDAAAMIEQRQHAHGWRSYFDHIEGRPIRSDIGGDLMDSWGYDQFNGEGALAQVLAGLRRGAG